jgi:hypothetical protein
MRIAPLIIAISLTSGAAYAQNTTPNQPSDIRDQKDAPTTAPAETNPSNPNTQARDAAMRPNTPAPAASEKK